MKHILAVLYFFISTLSFAQIDSRNIAKDFNNLSESQRLEIAKIIQQQATKATTTETIMEKMSPENISKWAEAGKGIGIAVGSAAKELGIAADAFLKTDAGRITLVLVTWKLIGKDFTHLIGGGVFFLVTASIWVYIYRKRYILPLVSEETITDKGATWLGIPRKDVVRKYRNEVLGERDEFSYFLTWVTGVLITVASVGIIFH